MLTERELVSVAMQICTAMKYLEQRNIIHRLLLYCQHRLRLISRRLCLRNILLTKDDNQYVAKVYNFGESSIGAQD
jgi:serine/threonine protein kinase